jgi:hypothetical protein
MWLITVADIFTMHEYVLSSGTKTNHNSGPKSLGKLKQNIIQIFVQAETWNAGVDKYVFK